MALTGSDAAAGVERIVYTTDGSAPTINGSDTVTNGTEVDAASASFNISTLGSTTVKWIAEDNVGNVSSVSSQTVKLDTTAPTAPTGFSFSSPTHAYWPGSGTTVFFQSGVSGGFTVAASGSADGESGVAGYTYPALGSGWSNTSGAYSFGSSAGTQSGSVTAQNNAGLSTPRADELDPLQQRRLLGRLVHHQPGLDRTHRQRRSRRRRAHRLHHRRLRT